jgi:hemoglobin
MNIYDQIGGFTAVRKLIVEFYNRVLDDDSLSPIFQNTDLERVIDHQTKFFAMLLGGPASYTDEQIKLIHARLGLTNGNFDRAKEHLTETMEDEGLDDEQIEFVVEQFEIRRKFIVHS